jgi:hypothetical protein
MTRRQKDTDALQLPAATDFNSGQFRTRFASEAVDLSELFKLVIGSLPLSGPVRFHVELAAPDGPSTGGGVQSVQHIKLVPEDGGATLVAGSADPYEGSCELRSLAYLDAQHHQRFQRSSLEAPPPPSARLDRKHYEQLLERLRVFFAERELSVRVVGNPEIQTEAQTVRLNAVSSPDGNMGSGRGLALLFGGLLGVLLAVVIYFIARR